MKSNWQENLKLLQDLGSSFDDLAKRIGASRISIHRWARGKATPLKVYQERIEETLKEAIRMSYAKGDDDGLWHLFPDCPNYPGANTTLPGESIKYTKFWDDLDNDPPKDKICPVCLKIERGEPRKPSD